MANVTRIKAKDDAHKEKAVKKAPKESAEEAEVIERKVRVKAKNSSNKKVAKLNSKEARKAAKAEKKAERKKAKAEKEPGYFRGAFQELRQVRWPDRKSTWKMVLSVVIYVVIIAVFIMLLDALFSLLFNQLLGGN